MAEQTPGWGAVGTDSLDSVQPGPRHGHTGPRLPQKRDPAKTGGREPAGRGSSWLRSEWTQGPWPVVTEGRSGPGDPDTGTLVLPLTMSPALLPHRPQAQAQSQVTAPRPAPHSRRAGHLRALPSQGCGPPGAFWERMARTPTGTGPTPPGGLLDRLHAPPVVCFLKPVPMPACLWRPPTGDRWLCLPGTSKLSPTSW